MQKSEQLMQNFLHQKITMGWWLEFTTRRPFPLSKPYRLNETERGELAARLRSTQETKKSTCVNMGVDQSYARYVLARDEALAYPRVEDMDNLFRQIIRKYLDGEKPEAGTIGFSPAMGWSATLKINLEDTHNAAWHAAQVVQDYKHSKLFWVEALKFQGMTLEDIAIAGFSPATGKEFTLNQNTLIQSHSFLREEAERDKAWQILCEAVKVLQSTSPPHFSAAWEQDLFSLIKEGAFSKEEESRTDANKRHQRNTRLRNRIASVLDGGLAFLSGKGSDIDKGRALLTDMPSLTTEDLEHAKVFLSYALRARKEKS